MIFYRSFSSDKYNLIKKRYILYSSIFMTVLLLMFSSVAHAFDLVPIFPENQVKKDVNYYDLRVYPGQKQTVELLVRNPQEDPITLYFRISTAMTNNFGTVDYMSFEDDYMWDTSLPFQFSDFIHVPQEVIVPPKSEGMIPITIDVPDQSFEGMLLGAIEVQSDAQASTQIDKSMQVNHKVRYLILMKLTESDQMPHSQIIWNGLDYDSLNHDLVLQLRNTVGAYIFDLNFHITIRTPENEVIFEKSIQQLEMAPYSYLDYALSLDDLILEENITYQVALTIIADNDPQEIQDTFTYHQKDLNQQLDQDVDKATIGFKLFIIFILLIAVISISMIIKKISKDVR